MKKIIILSQNGEARFNLVSYLKELFPECEIQITTHQSKSIEEEGRITEITVFKEKENERIRNLPLP
jgi:hypothetical protein